METAPEGYYQSFSAGKKRLEIIRKLVIEFAGVEIEEVPSPNPGEFMTHVSLSFQSPEQRKDFIDQMLELGRQDAVNRGHLDSQEAIADAS